MSGDASTAFPLRATWGSVDTFIVGYSGNMGRAHQLNGLIDAACALREEPAVCFLMIGDGAQRASLEARVRALGLRNVMFPSHISRASACVKP